MPNARRLHYIDWLKVLVVGGIFYYHASMPFVYGGWMIQNPQKSAALSVFAAIGYQFGIPFLFLIAGADAWLSLGERTRARYIRERATRLLVPLVFAFILLSPLQSYFMALGGHRYEGSFLAYVPLFFAQLPFLRSPAWLGHYGYHLWFLGFLFVYSVAALPLLTWLRSEGSAQFRERMAQVVSRPAGPFLFVLPVAAVQLTLRIRFPDYQDWADLFYWFVFYAAGALIVSDRRFTDAIRREARRALLWLLAVAAAFVPLGLSGQVMRWESHPEYSAGVLFYELLRSLHTWIWMLLLLNLGLRWLDRPNRFITHANEGVLPFYVIHHPILVVIAYYVVQWSAGVWTKHLFLAATGYLLTVGIYELLIRPYDPVRRLFGMKPRASAPAPRRQALRPAQPA